MKIVQKEIRSSGRCVYRMAGIKLFSGRVRPVTRLRGAGRPVLVVRIPGDAIGLFCHFSCNLGWMRWAEEHDCDCYIDMRTPKTVFSREHPIDYNPWDVFFRQSCDAADVANAKKLFVNVAPTPPDFPGVRPDLYDQGNPEFLAWRRFAREHIVFSDAKTRLVDERQAALIGDGREVLGCLVRGTDYARMKPAHHPVQPEPERVIADAKRICAERKLKKVFLATEDPGIRDLFRREFGDDLITSQTDLPDYRGDYLVWSGALGDAERTMRITEQYFVSVALLARCSCLLAGCASGAVGAALLSRGFDMMRIYDLGYYE